MSSGAGARAGAGAGSGKKNLEPEPPQNRPAPKPCPQHCIIVVAKNDYLFVYTVLSEVVLQELDGTVNCCAVESLRN